MWLNALTIHRQIAAYLVLSLLKHSTKVIARNDASTLVKRNNKTLNMWISLSSAPQQVFNSQKRSKAVLNMKVLTVVNFLEI